MAIPKIEWILRENMKPHVRHARIAHLTSTLCGLPPGLAQPSRDGLRCNLCIELEKQLATPEGQLIATALGHLGVTPDTWELARYVAEQGSLLATELDKARARIDALYRDWPVG